MLISSPKWIDSILNQGFQGLWHILAKGLIWKLMINHRSMYNPEIKLGKSAIRWFSHEHFCWSLVLGFSSHVSSPEGTGPRWSFHGRQKTCRRIPVMAGTISSGSWPYGIPMGQSQKGTPHGYDSWVNKRGYGEWTWGFLVNKMLHLKSSDGS